MARPKTYDVKHICDVITKYTDDTDMPIIKEICFIKKWTYRHIMFLAADNPELRDVLDLLVAKKEVFLEKKLINCNRNTSGVIFSLKQIGWRDEYLTDLQNEKIAVENKLTAKNVELADERLKVLKGETDLTQINEFLVSVKNLVGEETPVPEKKKKKVRKPKKETKK